MKPVAADVVIVGSGAGGGTVAAAVAPLVRQGLRVVVLEKGPRFADEEMSGSEREMAPVLYEDGGGFLNAEGTLTLAFGRAYGGSTVVYTGTSLLAPERVIRGWGVPGLEHADLRRRTGRYVDQNHVQLLPPEEINENNWLFVMGCQQLGYQAVQFPLNVKGCRGCSLCNLGCAHGAKQGTNRVQLPHAEAEGVEVVTRAEALRVEDHAVVVRVHERKPGEKGAPSEWPPGDYRLRAGLVVVAAGPVGSVALLLRSGLGGRLPRLGQGFTCHPAQILVAEHGRPIVNHVGHPKSFYLDRADEGYLLETCMYFPFTTAKSLSGFGEDHARLMRAFPRLQMILALAVDRPHPANRIEVDRQGRPVVRYTLTEEVVGSLTRATRTAARIFFAAGARRMHAPSADPPLIEAREVARLEERIQARHLKPGKASVSAAHLMGGCGMGRDATDSVTDAWGRVHGMPWLRVADASLFPAALEINPYLTVMALADRVAEKVREEAAGVIVSWVRRETA